MRVALAAAVLAALLASAGGARGAYPGRNGALVLLTDPTGTAAIYVVSLDGSRRIAIGNGENPVWSPDGTRIAYDGSNLSAQRGIRVVTLDGFRVVDRRTIVPHGYPRRYFLGDPSWSPDGRQIAYARGPLASGESSASACHCDLYLVRADGTDRRRLTYRGRTYSNEQPAWSPGGHRIAFSRCRGDGSCSIYTMRTNGRSTRPLVLSRLLAFSIAWAPHGRRIAYDVCGEKRCSLVVARADGSHRRRLPGEVYFEPTWSPDGSMLAASGAPPPGRPDCDVVVWLLRLDGTSIRPVTTGCRGSFDPDWQPLPR